MGTLLIVEQASRIAAGALAQGAFGPGVLAVAMELKPGAERL